MSWVRLNRRERPRYLIGEVVMRHLAAARDRSVSTVELETIRGLLLARLTGDEIAEFVMATAWDIEGVLEMPDAHDQFVLDFPPSGGFSDEDIPF